ncbi:MAG: HK97 family phage prohead protease [Nitrospinae bacterium]|nr:HK97 family phage prohead protease [Nitrospinota bacterium]
MTDFPVYLGGLEIRQRGGARVLSGRFPYGKLATTSNTGRRRKERIRSGAFRYQVKEFDRVQEELQGLMAEGADQVRIEAAQETLERRNIHILHGHDFNKPLGDRLRGTARVIEDDAAVAFEVDLPDENLMPTYMADAVKEIEINRAGGISPGFNVGPRGGERLVREPSALGDADVREVTDAVLFELSIVSRPVYAQTDLSLRGDAVHGEDKHIHGGAIGWL